MSNTDKQISNLRTNRLDKTPTKFIDRNLIDRLRLGIFGNVPPGSIVFDLQLTLLSNNDERE